MYRNSFNIPASLKIKNSCKTFSKQALCFVVRKVFFLLYLLCISFVSCENGEMETTKCPGIGSFVKANILKMKVISKTPPPPEKDS